MDTFYTPPLKSQANAEKRPYTSMIPIFYSPQHPLFVLAYSSFRQPSSHIGLFLPNTKHLRSPSPYYYMLALRANHPLESNLLLYLSYVLLAYTSFGSWKGKNIGERGQLALFLIGLANGVLLFSFFSAFSLLNFA